METNEEAEIFGVLTCFKNSTSLCVTIPAGACSTHKIHPGDRFLCRVGVDSVLRYEKVGQQGKHYHKPPADVSATHNQMNDGGMTDE